MQRWNNRRKLCYIFYFNKGYLITTGHDKPPIALNITSFNTGGTYFLLPVIIHFQRCFHCLHDAQFSVTRNKNYRNICKQGPAFSQSFHNHGRVLVSFPIIPFIYQHNNSFFPFFFCARENIFKSCAVIPFFCIK